LFSGALKSYTFSRPITEAVCKNNDDDWLNEEEIPQSDHCSQSESRSDQSLWGLVGGAVRALLLICCETEETDAPEVFKAQL